MYYNFDYYPDRRNTGCFKYDYSEKKYGVKDLLPFSVADMDFKVAPEITEKIKEVADKGVYGYSFLTEKYYNSTINILKKFNWNVEKEEIIFCPRIIQAMAVAVNTFSKEGDEIIYLSPGYSPLTECITDNHRIAVGIPLKREKDSYIIDYEEIENKISSKTKIFLLVNPHNPTGRVWSKEELRKISDICEKNSLIIISDEIHASFVYNNMKYNPFATISDYAANNSIIFQSISKTFNIPGIHLSNAIIKNYDLRYPFKKKVDSCGVHEGNIFIEPIVCTAEKIYDTWVSEINSYIYENYLYLKEFFKENFKELEVCKMEGTFLVWINYSNSNYSKEDIYSWFFKRAKIAVQFGEEFGEAGKGYIRFNIACPKEILKKALNLLKDFK